MVPADQTARLAQAGAHARLIEAQVEVDVLSHRHVLCKATGPFKQLAPVKTGTDQPSSMMSLDPGFRRLARARLIAPHNAPINRLKAFILLERGSQRFVPAGWP